MESYSYKKFSKNVNWELSYFDRERIACLRDWSYNFFNKNSLKYITWWNDMPDWD